MGQEYRICSRCIMDTSDPGISFGPDGICNRCRECERRHAADIVSRRRTPGALKGLVEEIKAEGRNNDYDCIIGVSGGVDSTYTAYIVKELGLKPLAIHLDNGWDSALAVSNIENCLKVLSIDLYTHVLDWDEFRDLQLAFLKASTPDSEIPTDHAIMSVLIRKAAELGIRHIITGVNMATEGISVTTWSMGHTDWRYIRSIHDRFGTVPLKSFPHCSLVDYAYFRYIKRQKQIPILDYVDYNKEDAVKLITARLGWEPYSGKHHESVYTRFYQSYILPRKFGFDKRRIHLSTLIMSGQITRDQALHEMEQEICPSAQVRQDRVFVAKKLGLAIEEFDRILALPPKTFYDYPSYEKTLAVRSRRAIKHFVREWRVARS